MISAIKKIAGRVGLFRINFVFIFRMVMSIRIFSVKIFRLFLFWKSARYVKGFVADVRDAPDNVSRMFSIVSSIPGESFSHPVPVSLEGFGHWKFHMTEYANPEIRTILLKQCTFLDANMYAVTSSDLLISEISRVFALPDKYHPLFARLFIPASGIALDKAVIFSQIVQDSYFHWLFEILPKFELLSKVAFEPDVYFISYSKPFQKESLDLLGVQPDMIKSPVDGDVFHCKEALAFTKTRTVSGWRCQYLRKLFRCWMKERVVSGRRLYVTRQNEDRRRVKNEEEVVELLLSYGFTVVDPGGLSLKEQVALFSGAECIVAPHGGALTNMVFASNGSKLIELFSPGYVNCCFWEIASLVGVEYYYLLGEGRTYGNRDPHLLYANMKINTDRLRKLLESAGIG